MKNYERLNAEYEAKKKTKKRVAAYCRVSTDSRDQANSFESQQRFFRDYIERNPDMELVQIYADKGLSGTNTKKRVEFNKMVAAAKAGMIDQIITKEVSRLARNTVDLLTTIRELATIGVGVLFLNDNIDTLIEQDEFRLTIMAGMAEQESRKTSERVKWGQERRMEQGVVFGGSLLGYDVVDGKMQINEEGAAIVREIFDKYVNQEKGVNTIANELREEGKKPRSGKDWNIQHIIRILRNEKYAGDLVQSKTYTPDFRSHDKKTNKGEKRFVRIENHHEQIVSRELFDAAQARLDSRTRESSKVGHSNRYCFSGKIVCGRCGERYVARYRENKDGSTSKYWACGEAHLHGKKRIDKAGNEIGCSMETIRDVDAMRIMDTVTDHLQMDYDRVINRIIKDVKAVFKSKSHTSDQEAVENELQKNKKALDRLLDMCCRDMISEEQFMEQRRTLLDEKDALLEKAKAIRTKQEMLIHGDAFIKNLRLHIENTLTSNECKESFYRSILDKMIVHDRTHVDVVLKLLSGEQRYLTDTINRTLNFRGTLQKRSSDNTDVPMSVSVARMRSSGME